MEDAHRRRWTDRLVIFALPAVIVAGVWWNDNANDDARVMAAADIRAAAEVSRLQACRARNTAQEYGRRNLDVALNGVLELSPESVNARRYVDEIVRPKLYVASQMDTDCTRNGALDPDDYESDMLPAPP